MHMADGFISPAVGCTMWAASAAITTLCARKVRQEKEMRLVPLMGVLGAFIFACQMLNFTIPGTGSSGHIGGGILLAHSYIQNNLPEGFAVPETRQELAVVLWNMAGKPEPASQQTYTDVQDEEVLKAVCWAVENELVTPETESTLGADVRVNRLQVIGAMYQTNKRKK